MTEHPELIAIVGMLILLGSTAVISIGSYLQTQRMLKWHRDLIARCDEVRRIAESMRQSPHA